MNIRLKSTIYSIILFALSIAYIILVYEVSGDTNIPTAFYTAYFIGFSICLHVSMRSSKFFEIKEWKCYVILAPIFVMGFNIYFIYCYLTSLY